MKSPVGNHKSLVVTEIVEGLRAKLGDELYEKLSALHEEFANHPNRSEALALLMHNAAVE